MATSQPAADQHRLAQIGLTVAAARAIDQAFEVLDVHRLRATLPEFTAAIAGIVHHYAPASSVLAIRHYTEQRVAAGVAGSFRPLPADVPALEQIASNVRWATKPLWGASPDVEAAQTNMRGAVGRLVQNVGRETTVLNVVRDREAHSWARVTRDDCCYFCAMLASRGAVYHSEGAAGADANAKFAGDGQFKFHDHCHCEVVPVFGLYKLPANAERWAAEWRRLAAENGGSLSLSQWRDHFTAAEKPAAAAA